MKTRLLLLLSLIIIVAVGWFYNQSTQALEVDVQLTSTPYPLTIGPSNMLVTLTDDNGKPVEGAVIKAAGVMDHEGAIPVYGRVTDLSDGQYSIFITWGMMGRWKFDLRVELPAEEIELYEEYDVFVYSLTPVGNVGNQEFMSVRQIEEMKNANAEKELWIVIPQGTQNMLHTGHFDDAFPFDMRLSVSGRNTLVIRNDDITDHTIGPFFIRSGESVRQTFTEPYVYVGLCSISYTDELSIIVEE